MTSTDAAGPIHPLGFALFLGTALSITAIPVLGRIMVELGITRTRLGAITIASAAVDDATGWILLASVAAVVNGKFEFWSMLRMIGLTLLFAATMIFLVRPLLVRWARSAMGRGQGEIGLSDLAVLIVCVLVCAIATNLIGIFAIFGAFFFGAVLSGEREFCAAVLRRMRDFMTVFFLPIFFTYTGLRTEIGSLGTIQLWLIFAVVLLAAVAGKWAGCGIAARLAGFTKREASCIGVMMNTRGPDGIDRHQRRLRTARHSQKRLLHARAHRIGDQHHDHAAIAVAFAGHGIGSGDCELEGLERSRRRIGRNHPSRRYAGLIQRGQQRRHIFADIGQHRSVRLVRRLGNSPHHS